MKKGLLNEIKAMNKIAGTQLTKKQEISIIRERLQQLQELDFGSQKAFDAYQKNHDLRGDTKVTVAGKKMSVTQAVKQSDGKALKGSPVFGKKKKSGKDYIVKGDSEVIVRVDDTIETTESALEQIITDPKKNTRALAKYAMDSISDMKKIVKQLKGNHNHNSGKDYIVKGDNEVIVRVDDSIETAEEALNQIITDPKKNTRALAKYAMDSISDMKKIVKQLKK
jgi:hypothetical protein